MPMILMRFQPIGIWHAKINEALHSLDESGDVGDRMMILIMASHRLIARIQSADATMASAMRTL